MIDSNSHPGVQEGSPFLLIAGHSFLKHWTFQASHGVSTIRPTRYRKTWIHGQWGIYAREKKLRQGDRVKLTMAMQENGVRNYQIKAERNIAMGMWVPIEEWHARNGN